MLNEKFGLILDRSEALAQPLCLVFIISYASHLSTLGVLRHPPPSRAFLGLFCSSKFYQWWDAVLQKRLAWALFALLLSTLVCCQPTELILSFFLFHKFFILPPPPHPQRALSHAKVQEAKSLQASGQAKNSEGKRPVDLFLTWDGGWRPVDLFLTWDGGWRPVDLFLTWDGGWFCDEICLFWNTSLKYKFEINSQLVQGVLKVLMLGGGVK